MSEAIVRGVLGQIGPSIDWRSSSVEVARDSGKTEFPAHARTLALLRQLESTLFVLDGDASGTVPLMQQAAASQSHTLKYVLLPGKVCPEEWLWQRLACRRVECASEFGISPDRLRDLHQKIGSLFASAADTPRNIAKNRLQALCEELSQAPARVARIIAAIEMRDPASDLAPFATELREKIEDWRSRA